MPEQEIKMDIPVEKNKIGQLLILEGHITQDQLDTILNIQKIEKECLGLSLGKVLSKINAISKEDLEDALHHPNLRKNIGSIAVENKLITKDDLAFCLKKKKPNQMIGKVLVENGLLTENAIGNLLTEQINSPKIGKLLLDLELIAEKDLIVALKIQKSTRPVGEILCALNMVTPEVLNNVLKKYDKQVGIEHILLMLGYITDKTLLLVQEIHDKTAVPIDKIFLEKNIISKEQLQHANAKKYNLPFRHLKNFIYTNKDKENLSNLIERKFAEENLILPLKLDNNILQIAIFNHERINFQDELKKLHENYKIELVFITDNKFDELFEILYSKKLSAVSKKDKEEQSDDIDFMDIDLDENIDEKVETIDIDNQDIEAEELVNFILKYGILNNASDIHIEQDRDGPKIRYRIDGIIQDMDVAWLKHKLPNKLGLIISRIKEISNLDVTERRLPQDGVFRINYYDKEKGDKFDLDFRTATCRAIVGENVTIRILDSRNSNVLLENLGHTPHILDPLKRMLKTSSGIVLISGPTGSGKTASLYSSLRYVYNPGIKIITAEDPIEYSFPGIMQTQTNQKIGLNYPRLIKSFLRLDPDIILIGEIKDSETATISFDAAQTGHLILSTIHTNDAVSAVTRLNDLNIDSSQISACLLSVLAQRLIRRICPFCKVEYVPTEDEWKMLFENYPSELTFFRGEGCKSCNFTGFKGQVLLSEIFVIDKEIGYSLSKGLAESDIKKMAIEAGMKTMLEDGLSKLDQSTLSEIIRVIPHDMIKTFQARNQAQQNADDLIEKLFGNYPQSKNIELVTESFLIRKPESELYIMEKMFNKYSTICEHNNYKFNADIKLFYGFIKESYYQIKNRYGCQSVSFTVRNINNNAEISAQPEV
jgi:type IV pilus assembly protein PilB